MKLASLSVCAFLLIAGIAQATTHVISFGPASFTYSPATLNVNVGDTIQWTGDFQEHPLSSISFPTGAPAITHINSGTTYTYVVPMVGTYNYQCDSHAAFGMVGSFTAAASGVAPVVPIATDLVNAPNPATATTSIRYTLARADHITIRLFDTKGSLVKTLIDETQNEGSNSVLFDTRELTSGSYNYVLSSPTGMMVRQLIVVR